MNMLTSGSNLPTMTIKTRVDDRFSTSSRRVSEEMLFSHSSLEVYYGGASIAVPFMWESQPGTPKVRFRETPLPPLTPPPSFLFNTPKRPTKKHSNPNKGSLLYTVLPKFTPGRKSQSPASPASSEFSSWSLSNSPPYTPNICRKVHFSIPRSSIESPEEDGYKLPVSTLCFGISRKASERSCSRIIKVLLGESA